MTVHLNPYWLFEPQFTVRCWRPSWIGWWRLGQIECCVDNRWVGYGLTRRSALGRAERGEGPGCVKIVAVVHGYPPGLNAGAEWTLHEMLLGLKVRGHEPLVYCPLKPEPFEGIEVQPPPADLTAALAEADVVLTHLDWTTTVIAAMKRLRVPCAHLVHNHLQLRAAKVRPGPRVLAIANSDWIHATIPREFRRLVCHPVVPLWRYELPRADREMVTLVNVQAAKGAARFGELARAFPQTPFLAVKGSYGVQVVPDATNVETLENTPSMVTDVYARTKVLLMPSAYESWGRCAIEGACSGIPTIAEPTKGLVESLGPTGFFPRRPADWHTDLRRLLDDRTAYEMASANARARAEELAAAAPAELDRLEAELDRLTRPPAPKSARVPRPPSTPVSPSGEIRVTVVVPWEASPSREAVWSWIRTNFWDQLGWPIHLAESEGGFSKARAVNATIAGIDTDVIVVTDADVVVSPTALLAATEWVVPRDGWAMCHKLCYRLNQDTTEVLMVDGWEGRVHPVPRSQLVRAPMGPVPAGGLFVITRAGWDRIDGFDERFVGPGGEDTALGLTAATILGAHGTTGDTMWHLWHEPAIRERGRVGANMSLVTRYRHAAWDRRRMAALLAERGGSENLVTRI